MANTFYIGYASQGPDLVVTLTDDNNVPIQLDEDGAVVLRLQGYYQNAVDITGTISDQSDDANWGKVTVSEVAWNGVTPLNPGIYKAQWRYTNADDELFIFPTEASPFDMPIVDTIVVQQSL